MEVCTLIESIMLQVFGIYSSLCRIKNLNWHVAEDNQCDLRKLSLYHRSNRCDCLTIQCLSSGFWLSAQAWVCARSEIKSTPHSLTSEWLSLGMLLSKKGWRSLLWRFSYSSADGTSKDWSRDQICRIPWVAISKRSRSMFDVWARE